MIKRFANAITKLFIGNHGIKTVYQGKNKIYERTGGYIYIELEK